MTHLCNFRLKFVCLQDLLDDWICLLSSRHWNQRRHLTEPTHRHGPGVINIDTLNFLHYTIHSSIIPISCDVHAEIWVQIHALSISFKRLKTATCSRRHDRMSVNLSTELIIIRLWLWPDARILADRDYDRWLSVEEGVNNVSLDRMECLKYAS